MYGSDTNHYPGSIAPYLATAITGMIEAGFTEEERCQVLAETVIRVVGLERGEDEEGESVDVVDGSDDQQGTSPVDGNDTEEDDPPSSSGGNSFSSVGLSLSCLAILSVLC